MHINSIIRYFIVTILILFILGGISMATPIPSEVKSVVVFIFVRNLEGRLIANGTGSFVGVKNPLNSNFHVYLVTAKHVLYKTNTMDFVDTVFLRINRKEGGCELGSFPIISEGEECNVFTHSDYSVGIVVISCLPDQEKYDFKFLADDLNNKRGIQRTKNSRRF